MFLIKEKKLLNPTVVYMAIEAPLIARKAQPGQFVILRVTETGERIPLTIADHDAARGTVSIIFQVVGSTTEQLAHLAVGDSLCDFVGPLGKPTETKGLRKVAVVGGGVGCAIAYPVAKKLSAEGCEVHSIIGFREKELVILADAFRDVSDRLYLMTDDGGAGERGLVTDALRRLLEAGETYDEVITIGPLPMMKFVCLLTREFGVKTIASMNPIMIDGTGMCGGCRLTVGGKTVFACVDGPEFDGHEIDFDACMARADTYASFERARREETCRLLREEK